MSESPHETVVRVLEEEGHRNPIYVVENMREHVAYIDKLRADRLYLARCMHNCMETSAENRDYYKKQVATLEEELRTLKG